MTNFLWTTFFVFLFLGNRQVLSETEEETDQEDLDWNLQEGFGTGQNRSPFFSRGPFFRSGGRNASSGWPRMYLPSLVNASTSAKCKDELLFVFKNLPDLRAQMVDSWGKIPDGLFMGNLDSDGSYSQCLSLKYNDQSHAILGKYCSVTYSRWPGSRYSSDLRRSDDILTNARIAQWSGVGDVYPLGFITYGTCIPSACTQEDLNATIDDTLEGNHIVSQIHCVTAEDQIQLSAGDIAFITVLVLLFTLMVVSAAVDIYIDLADKQDARKGPLRYLLVFSLSTNFRKLFHVSENNAPETISCVHGIRVLSMSWVLWGHQHLVNIKLFSNLMSVGTKTTGLFFQIIGNATVSVDSFFFMSGLLVSYGVMKELQKRGRLDVITFYAHRLIRLTPPIALTCGYLTTISRFFTSGPRSGLFDTFQSNICQKHWWKDILYVNNFLGYNEKGVMEDCIGQCWYTAVDTQLFIIAPLLLLPLHFYPGIGQILLCFVSLVSVMIPAIITVVGDYPPGLITGVPAGVGNRYMRYIYVTPWCRAGAWIVGIWTGYILFKYNQKRFSLKTWQVAAGWVTATFMALSVLFGMWSYNQFFQPKEYDVMTQFLYGGFHRTVWAMALAWVVFACHTGYGGFVNTFLSYPAWQPLSRLTFTMFLMSILVQQTIGFSRKTPIYFTLTEIILETCGSMFIVSIAATIVTLTVESPIIGLEKILFGRSGPAPRGKGKSDHVPLASRSVALRQTWRRNSKGSSKSSTSSVP